MSYYAPIQAIARRIKSGHQPPPIQFGSACATCYKSTEKALQCSACHCVRYCSPACQKLSWKGDPSCFTGRGGYYQKTHKAECPHIKNDMLEHRDLLVILKQFPWARVEENNAFFFELALAISNVLGSGPDVGWWVMDEPDTGLTVKKHMESSYGPGGSAPVPTPSQKWGKRLLSSTHFDEKSGWNLPDKEIPWLTFTQARRPPSFPPVFEHNWTSYYKWRKLPLRSIAALLLNWPLSIYRLLYLLGFVPSEGGGNERRKLNIHCLGVEVELNFLPVFGELALLLPNTDIDILLFGQGAYDLSSRAKSPALAAKDYVYEYRAPKECGSGSIRIQLYKSSLIWDPHLILKAGMIPDVLIGLNAGMSMFPTWSPVFATSRALSIPFAITEFARSSLEEDLFRYEDYVHRALEGGLGELVGEEKIGVLVESLKHPPASAINPFMRPGHRAAQTHNMPTAINGFTCIVTPRPEVGSNSVSDAPVDGQGKRVLGSGGEGVRSGEGKETSKEAGGVSLAQ